MGNMIKLGILQNAHFGAQMQMYPAWPAFLQTQILGILQECPIHLILPITYRLCILITVHCLNLEFQKL